MSKVNVFVYQLTCRLTPPFAASELSRKQSTFKSRKATISSWSLLPCCQVQHMHSLAAIALGRKQQRYTAPLSLIGKNSSSCPPYLWGTQWPWSSGSRKRRMRTMEFSWHHKDRWCSAKCPLTARLVGGASSVALLSAAGSLSSTVLPQLAGHICLTWPSGGGCWAPALSWNPTNPLSSRILDKELNETNTQNTASTHFTESQACGRSIALCQLRLFQIIPFFGILISVGRHLVFLKPPLGISGGKSCTRSLECHHFETVKFGPPQSPQYQCALAHFLTILWHLQGQLHLPWQYVEWSLDPLRSPPQLAKVCSLKSKWTSQIAALLFPIDPGNSTNLVRSR